MKKLLSFLAAGTATMTAAPAAAEELAFGKAPVSETELAEQRGGFVVPGGLNISIAVQTDTRVNGVLLLRSIFVADRGPAVLSVFGRTDPVPEGTASAAANGANSGSTSAVTVGTASRIDTAANQPEGLTKLELTPGAPGVSTAAGVVRLDQAGRGQQVVLTQPTLDVRHLVGQAYGTIAANRGNDVAVDTSTIINLDLGNVTPLSTGSVLFRVEALGLDAASQLGRR